MLRMKVTAVSLVVLGALLFGSVVAYAGWGWNAKANIEGTKISMSWAVTDDTNGAADYHAEITVAVPDGTDIDVFKVSPTETVEVVDGGSCSGGTVHAVVTYVVTSLGGDGSAVSVSVDQVGKAKEHFGHDSGVLGQSLSVEVDVPGNC